jgi:single-strand DNA-binding protein
MSSVNKSILIGRVGQDPELRYTADGTPVATFSLATSESYKQKDGSKKEVTEWHRLVAWRKLGEVAGQYVRKGSLLYIEGKIQSREWTDREGGKRKATDIVVSSLRMLGQPGNAANRYNVSGSSGSPGRDPGDDDDFIHEPDEEDVPV